MKLIFLTICLSLPFNSLRAQTITKDGTPGPQITITPGVPTNTPGPSTPSDRGRGKVKSLDATGAPNPNKYPNTNKSRNSGWSSGYSKRKEWSGAGSAIDSPPTLPSADTPGNQRPQSSLSSNTPEVLESSNSLKAPPCVPQTVETSNAFQTYSGLGSIVASAQNTMLREFELPDRSIKFYVGSFLDGLRDVTTTLELGLDRFRFAANEALITQGIEIFSLISDVAQTALFQKREAGHRLLNRITAIQLLIGPDQLTQIVDPELAEEWSAATKAVREQIGNSIGEWTKKFEEAPPGEKFEMGMNAAGTTVGNFAPMLAPAKLLKFRKALDEAGEFSGYATKEKIIANAINEIREAERAGKISNEANFVDKVGAASKVGTFPPGTRQWAKKVDNPKVKTAEEANNIHQSKGYQPPYQLGTNTVEGVLRENTTGFVRLHGPNNQAGDFLVSKESINGLSATDIEKKLSLKYTPTHISDVHIPAGTVLRRGHVQSNFGGGEGAIQYEIIYDIDRPKGFDNWFENMRPLK